MNTTHTDQLAQDFVKFSVEAGVLRFGEFKTKAGRLSPHFFNAGLFSDGLKLQRLAGAARRLVESGIEFDMLFGPAYKGITLAGGRRHRAGPPGPQQAPCLANRKEAKDHGEAAAPCSGRACAGPCAHHHRRRDLGGTPPLKGPSP